jgi:hypothetical protein
MTISERLEDVTWASRNTALSLARKISAVRDSAAPVTTGTCGVGCATNTTFTVDGGAEPPDRPGPWTPMNTAATAITTIRLATGAREASRTCRRRCGPAARRPPAPGRGRREEASRGFLQLFAQRREAAAHTLADHEL